MSERYQRSITQGGNAVAESSGLSIPAIRSILSDARKRSQSLADVPQGDSYVSPEEFLDEKQLEVYSRDDTVISTAVEEVMNETGIVNYRLQRLFYPPTTHIDYSIHFRPGRRIEELDVTKSHKAATLIYHPDRIETQLIPLLKYPYSTDDVSLDELRESLLRPEERVYGIGRIILPSQNSFKKVDVMDLLKFTFVDPVTVKGRK